MTPILTTKLHIPQTRSKSLSRQRLIEQLEFALHNKHRLILLVAPAGFGKSTLLSTWLTAKPHPTAWLSLDENDNHLPRFLYYLLTTLKPYLPALGEEDFELLQTEQEPPIEPILATVVNVANSLSEPLVLVLEDYHLVNNPKIDAAVSFLLEHLPEHLHLVITSREDPDLSLSRLRVRDQLTEIRADDLRFNLEEVSAFLQQMAGLELIPEQIALLEDRTEGWIAGLQLAVLSLNKVADKAQFLTSFGGSHRYIMDYLVDEVLDLQSEETRQFLLQTSLLQRMTGELCNQITGKKNGQQTLEKLEAANLFIVPLDAEKRWYRYHHLFAELLRFRLNRQPNLNLSELHLKASEWYKATGLMDEAVYHAVQSGQAEEIETLLSAVVDLITRDNQIGMALKWFEAIPAELIKQRAGLTLFKGWFLALADQTEQSNIYAEMGKELITPDSHIFEQGILEATLAYNARLQLDIPAALEHGEKAKGLLSEKYPSIRNAMLMLLGQSKLLLPEYFDEGLQQVKKALADARKLENRFVLGSSLSTLVFVLIGQARLREAMLLLDQFEHHQDSVKWVRSLRATIYYLRNELQKATDELGKVIKEGQGATLDLINNAWAYVLRGLVYRGEGNTTKALETFQQIEAAGVSLPPTIRVAPYKFTLLVEMGRLEEATFWATEEGFTPNDPIPPEMDDYYLCYTRILIAQQHFTEALTVLKTLEELASSLDTNYRLAAVHILQAIVFIKAQRRSLAKDYLSKAVALVAPANIIRTFLDEDPIIAELLMETRATAPQFVDAILAAYRQKPEESSPLVEPLSEREEEILRLIAQGLSNREIGERLYLAVGTVKRHAVNIFGKLEVNSRTEAVARARELNLL